MAAQELEVMVQGPRLGPQARKLVNKKLSSHLFVGQVEGAAKGEGALG